MMILKVRCSRAAAGDLGPPNRENRNQMESDAHVGTPVEFVPRPRR